MRLSLSIPFLSAIRLARPVRQALACGVVVCLGVAAAAPPAAAQEARDSRPHTGTVKGSVFDPMSQPASGAVVVFRSAAGLARESRTDARGTFVVTGVQPGSYDVLVSLDGFRADITRVDVHAGETSAIAVTLRLSAITETMVVSASFVDTPLSESPSGTVSISRHDIESRQFVTVADALRLVPGSAVAANGGAGSVTSLFARGGESDFTLVMVDGVKLNSFGGGFDFGHLTTGGLSSLEIVRGPQSAVFGADAIGGVVQLRTSVGGPDTVSASIESGGNGTRRVVAGTTGSTGGFGWGAHVEGLSSEGWTDEAPGGADPVSNDDYAGLTVALAGSWQASPRTAIRVDTRYGSNERGNPGPFGSNPIGAFPGIDTVARGTNTLALGSVSATHEWNPQTALRARGSWMQLDSDFGSAWGDSMSRTRRFSAHVQLDRAFGSAMATTAGIDADVERADSTYITGTAAGRIPVTRRVTGYFGEARVRGGSRLFLTAGLRVEHIVRDALEADPFAFAPRPDLPRDAVLSPNPRVAASYYARTSQESGGNWSRVHASAGTGIRSADAFEIAFTDNPGLKPERSRSVDAGFEQSLFGGRLIVDGTVFSNDYDDLIVAVGRSFANLSRYRTDNISNARARGIELSAAWRTVWGLEARTAYTFVDSEVLEVDHAGGTAPPPFTVGDPLVRRPRHQASVDLVFTRKAWTAYGRASGRGRALDVEPNFGAFGGLFPTPAYAVVDAGVSIRLGLRTALTARVDNLLNHRYEGVLGYPAPGRTFTVGVRLAAGR